MTIEKNGKVYTATYDLLTSGVVRLQTGQATQLGGLTEDGLASLLLHQAIDSGHADRLGLGRPKTE